MKNQQKADLISVSLEYGSYTYFEANQGTNMSNAKTVAQHVDNEILPDYAFRLNETLQAAFDNWKAGGEVIPLERTMNGMDHAWYVLADSDVRDAFVGILANRWLSEDDEPFVHEVLDELVDMQAYDTVMPAGFSYEGFWQELEDALEEALAPEDD